MHLEPGRSLSHFRIVARIGAGGMGVVYRAVDEKLDRPVAIKVLPPERMADPERRRRFRREARAEAALNHPNIAAIHEVDESSGLVFLVMEYVEGRTLREKLQARPLPVAEALRIGAEIAEGLAHAHEHRVIHRDLKPENVMVRDDGHVKLLDFGLAKLLEEPRSEGASPSTASTQTAELSGAGRVLGTVEYMSPEQARGQGVDHRSDVFSFGALLYEMVTGLTPFRGETSADTLSGILEREAAPASTWNALVPEGLERLLRRCLAKAPAERYDSARDLRADLLALGGEAPRPAARRWSRRQAAWTGLRVLAVIALFLSWGGSRWGWFGAPYRTLAVLPFETVGAEGEAAYLGDGIAESLIRSLTRLPELTVYARSTVEELRGEEPREVGRRLPRVQAVVTGRVQQRGELLVIGAELVDARTGLQLWGEQYQRSPDEMLSVESEVAREIVDELRLTLTPEQDRRLAKQPAADPEAYRLYLKGRWYVNQMSDVAAAQKAKALFEEALQIDPSLALAHAGLADAFYGVSNISAPPSDVMPRARAAAEVALEIDPDLAEAQVTLGIVDFGYDWKWRTAEARFRRALELNPGYARGHQFLGMLLVCDGRSAEALVELRRAVELDPLPASAGLYVAFAYYNAPPGQRQYDRAIEEAGMVLRFHPDFFWTHGFLGQVYGALGRHEESLAEMQRTVEMASTAAVTFPLTTLAWAYANAGQADRAHELLLDIETRIGAGQQFPVSYVAEIHAALGDLETAFTWLERAFEHRDEELVYIKVNPRLDPLRDDPRFADLVRRMDLDR